MRDFLAFSHLLKHEKGGPNGWDPPFLLKLLSLKLLKPVDQTTGITPIDVIKDRAISLCAVLVQLGFGHSRFFHQIQDELVLLGGYPTIPVLSLFVRRPPKRAQRLEQLLERF